MVVCVDGARDEDSSRKPHYVGTRWQGADDARYDTQLVHSDGGVLEKLALGKYEIGSEVAQWLHGARV